MRLPYRRCETLRSRHLNQPKPVAHQLRGMPPRPLGILLVGHGTRDGDGTDEFLSIAKQVAIARPQQIVEPCFLELAEPSISTAVATLAEQGVEQMIVMPLLLFAAGHAKRDVPRAIASALGSYPRIRWTQAAHLGCHPAILAQSEARFREALDDRMPTRRETTALVFVGRGSQDDEATCEMRHFASLAHQSNRVGVVKVSFLAMAQPSYPDTLELIAAEHYQRVVVQPHLLFSGELIAGIRQTIETFAAKFPDTEWLVTDPLGPTSAVSTAVLQRIEEAQASISETAARAQIHVATTLM